MSLLIYGANGYTGRLVAREALDRGLRPVLAGRSASELARLATELGCAVRVFRLDRGGADTAVRENQIDPHLADVRVVLNCAGPFSATAAPLHAACLRCGVHYLDITGEIDVIEAAAAQHEQALRAGIVLLPAVGFDVVPSDCLAALVARELPGATHLRLAIAGDGGLSPGTAKTVLQSLPSGGRARIDGKIVRVPLGWKWREIPFQDRVRWATTIAWGDVASAYYSTGIPNIETYMAVSRRQVARMARFRALMPLVGWAPLRWLGRRWIERRVRGPSAEELAQGRASLWAEVQDPAGRTVSATLTTPSGYRLTAIAAVRSAEKVLAGSVPPGFKTPSMAFGADFVLTLPEVDFRWAQRG